MFRFFLFCEEDVTVVGFCDAHSQGNLIKCRFEAGSLYWKRGESLKLLAWLIIALILAFTVHFLEGERSVSVASTTFFI